MTRPRIFEDQFDSLRQRSWLNTAHQGPLPRVAADRALASIEEKLDPRRIPEESFFEIPELLRRQLARLIGADPNGPPDHYELRTDLGAAAYDVFCTANHLSRLGARYRASARCRARRSAAP